jgi:hypothetical protein
MQAGMIPAGDGALAQANPSVAASQPTVTVTGQPAAVVSATNLTPSQISAFENVLTALSATLGQLNAEISSNTLTPSQMVAVQSTLGGIGNTLVAMANEVSNGNVQSNMPAAAATAPIASNSKPSQSVAQNTPATTPSAPAPTIAAGTQPAVTAQASPAANAPQQTAQASSLWSFTKAHWPTIVIILIVLAILAILFWPEKETVKTVPSGTSGAGKPKPAPFQPIAFSQDSIPASTPAPTVAHNNPAPATPVASAVAAPSQK